MYSLGSIVGAVQAAKASGGVPGLANKQNYAIFLRLYFMLGFFLVL